MIAWRKETREGVVPQPLCNFTARIVAEEVLDDGAEQRTVFVIEGELPGRRPLPPTRVPAERYPGMSWVTEAWGTAPVIFAGQGKRDHLRAAIQMLSGSVPRRTVYGHLGWRRIGDRWAYLHSGGAIGPRGRSKTSKSTPAPTASCPASCRHRQKGARSPMRCAPRSRFWSSDPTPSPRPSSARSTARRSASRARSTSPLHLAGPTGAFKTELAALAQAHFGAAFNGRHLPASWADTANMLEKKAFLAKDAVLVVDDFAPTGTTTDVQRLHREADRLFRAAGNRAGRARMRADGGSRPTYYPRGLIISTGEDIPSGQSLRARLLVLELTPGEIPAAALSAAQAAARAGCSRQPWRDICAGLRPASTISRRTLPERQRALRDTLGPGQRAPAHARHRSQPDPGLGDVPAALPKKSERSAALGCSVLLDAGARRALTDSAEVQRAHQASEEPAARFLALLGAAISSGRAHLADAETGAQPEDAASLGLAARPSSAPATTCGRSGARTASGSAGSATTTSCWIRRPPSPRRRSWRAIRAQAFRSSSGRSGSGWPSRDCSHRATGPGARTPCVARSRACGAICCTFERACSPLKLDQSATKLTSTTKLTRRRRRKAADSLAVVSLVSLARKREHRGPEERDLRDAVGWEVEI